MFILIAMDRTGTYPDEHIGPFRTEDDAWEFINKYASQENMENRGLDGPLPLYPATDWEV